MTNELEAIDTLGARLNQASGTLAMLINDGEEAGGFRSGHAVIVSTLWATSELINQAQAALAALDDARRQEHAQRNPAT